MYIERSLVIRRAFAKCGNPTPSTRADELKRQVLLDAAASYDLEPTTELAESRTRRKPKPAVRWRAVAVSAGLACILLLAAAMFSMSMYRSMPGARLYGAKRAVEQLRVSVLPSGAGKASALLSCTTSRLEELDYVKSHRMRDWYFALADDAGRSLACSTSEIARITAETASSGVGIKESEATLIGTALSKIDEYRAATASVSADLSPAQSQRILVLADRASSSMVAIVGSDLGPGRPADMSPGRDTPSFSVRPNGAPVPPARADASAVEASSGINSAAPAVTGRKASAKTKRKNAPAAPADKSASPARTLDKPVPPRDQAPASSPHPSQVAAQPENPQPKSLGDAANNTAVNTRQTLPNENRSNEVDSPKQGKHDRDDERSGKKRDRDSGNRGRRR